MHVKQPTICGTSNATVGTAVRDLLPAPQWEDSLPWTRASASKAPEGAVSAGVLFRRSGTVAVAAVVSGTAAVDSLAVPQRFPMDRDCTESVCKHQSLSHAAQTIVALPPRSAILVPTTHDMWLTCGCRYWPPVCALPTISVSVHAVTFHCAEVHKLCHHFVSLPVSMDRYDFRVPNADSITLTLVRN